MVTDVLTLKNGTFVNLTFAGDINTSVPTLRNFYVYSEDIDGDGVVEIPSTVTMKPLSTWQTAEERQFLRWYSLDDNGWEYNKLFTFS